MKLTKSIQSMQSPPFIFHFFEGMQSYLFGQLAIVIYYLFYIFIYHYFTAPAKVQIQTSQCSNELKTEGKLCQEPL